MVLVARASIVFSWKFPFKLTVPAVDLLLVSLLLFTFALNIYLSFVSSVLSFSCRLSSDLWICYLARALNHSLFDQ